MERRVDPQGKLSAWDRHLRVGQHLAGRSVVLTFDATRRLVVVRDHHDRLLVERPLPWLTDAWLWAGLEDAEQPADQDGNSTFR